MNADELDYLLPEGLIARRPLAERSAARLLVVAATSGGHVHARVRDLPNLIEPGSLVVVNDTRVLPARLFGKKPSGGKVELLLIRKLDRAHDRCSQRWLAMGRSSKPLREGTVVDLGELVARIEAPADGQGLVTIRVEASEPIDAVLDRVGHVPLPPYLQREDEPSDRERYQTVFARHAGAVAAPTAGLHFDDGLLAALSARGCELASITLHVGPGTFRPVTVDHLDEHVMHAEDFVVSPEVALAVARARARSAPVVAIGTTVVRALEAAADPERPGLVRAIARDTDLFIRPGFRFRVVDGLMTNFHLPRSTLLALVFAFGGVEPVRDAYREAVRAEYRFYSYGDAMFIPQRATRNA
jgi:S-adenosylmethionine:tRNA ribosyltransferase-isomerase